MSDLRVYWNDSTAIVPEDKDPSNYAKDKERVFPRHSMVCDLGGGGGADSLYFLRKGHEVKLIDISDLALARAMRAAEKQDTIALETIRHNFEDGAIPLPPESCGIVYSRLALHYFDSGTLSQLFAAIYRTLKPGSKAYLTLKSPDDKAEMEYLRSAAREIEKGVFDEDGHTKTRFTIEQLKRTLDDANIPSTAYTIQKYHEDLGGRKDKVKSGNTKFLVNEIMISKS
jgi:SAM-dependent methyltransferase